MFLRRLAILALTLPLAGVATWHAALGYQHAQAQGSMALAIASAPQLRVQNNEKLASSAEELTRHAESIRRDALAALVAEPLNPVALRQLGMIEGLAQGDAGATLFRVAERSSRRDFLNQLVLIEWTAREGKVASTLAHYDRALLVQPASSSKFFPVLANALVEPEIRNRLSAYAKAPWFAGFVSTALANGAKASQVVDVVSLASHDLLTEEAQAIRMPLAGQLVQRAEYAALQDLVQAMPSDIRRTFQDLGFSSATMQPDLAPFTWRIANTVDVEASLDSGGRLDVRIAPERKVTIAERVTMFKPGRYEFRQDLEHRFAEPRASLAWQANCTVIGQDGTFWQAALPAVAGNQTYRADIVIPEGCVAQAWKLRGAAEVGQFASLAQVRSISLVRR